MSIVQQGNEYVESEGACIHNHIHMCVCRSMASVGVNTNGSQFHVSLAPSPHLNGRSVVFGRLSAGEDVLARIEKVFTYKGVPATDIVISACEVVEKK